MELKPQLAQATCRPESRFNRTSVELKRLTTARISATVNRFNRTSVELKPHMAYAGIDAPLGFNRTSVELKPL